MSVEGILITVCVCVNWRHLVLGPSSLAATTPTQKERRRRRSGSRDESSVSARRKVGNKSGDALLEERGRK